VCTVGAQDTEDGAHDDGEYGGEEPLREQVNELYVKCQLIFITRFNRF